VYGELPEIETKDGQQKIQGFGVHILRPEKFAVLRLPSNDEMMEYLAKQRSLYRDLGNRKGEGESVPNPQADLALFERIRIDRVTDESQKFDAAEAAKALFLITMHKIEPYVREGDGYRITLKTIFGDTVHVIKIPFEKDMSLYTSSVYKSRDLPHNVEERRFPPEAPVRLYDSAIESIEGYTPEFTPKTVPPHHKRAVVFELVSALRDLDPALDPNS
jgi:hypothetical protein